MLPVAIDCAADRGGGGASTIALIFLFVFTALLVFDASVTAIAIFKTVSRQPPPDCKPRPPVRLGAH